MNLVNVIPSVTGRFRVPKQVISTSWEDRHTVLKSNVNLFCWKRQAIPEMESFLANATERDLKPISFYTHIDDLSSKLNELKLDWSGAIADAGDAFRADVHELAYDFINSFSKEKCGTVYLKLVSDNECTKYHTDGYSLRLFTTYHGAGTQWLPERGVNRAGLGKTNGEIVKDPSFIQQMDTFEVGILKGELPNRINKVKGIVHRSPEIEKTGEKRIILRIDI